MKPSHADKGSMRHEGGCDKARIAALEFRCSVVPRPHVLSRVTIAPPHQHQRRMAEVQTPLTSVAPDMEVDKVEQAMYSFNFSDFLRREYRFGLDPNRPSCKAYMQGHCPLGNRCPDRHHVSSSYNKYVGSPKHLWSLS
jgi:hypothetical protein